MTWDTVLAILAGDEEACRRRLEHTRRRLLARDKLLAESREWAKAAPERTENALRLLRRVVR